MIAKLSYIAFPNFPFLQIFKCKNDELSLILCSSYSWNEVKNVYVICIVYFSVRRFCGRPGLHSGLIVAPTNDRI